MKKLKSVRDQEEVQNSRYFIYLRGIVEASNPDEKQKCLLEYFECVYKTNPEQIAKWAHYASNQMYYLRSKGFRMDEVPLSIVHSVIHSIILLDRGWDPSEVSLDKVMHMLIRSNLMNKAAHSKRFIQWHPCRGIPDEEEEESTDILSNLPGQTLEDIYAGQDRKELLARCRIKLESGKYPVLLQIFDGLLEGKGTKELSIELRMPVHKILNLRRLLIKNLRRHFRKHKRGQGNEK